MRITLEVKNKWGLIDGSIAVPSRDSAQYPAWRRCNLFVCSWLFRSVHSTIAQSLMHFDKSRDIWEDLRRRFLQYDALRISILQNDIYNLKQQSLSVSDYYTKSRTLCEELNTLRPLPICKERDTDQVIRFLQGLNEDYNNLKSNILVLDPLPEIYKVFVMAEKLERQINLTNLSLGNMEINHANAAHTNQSVGEETTAATLNNFNDRRSNVNKPKCTYCRMI
ncbi:PREDICTED: uncharacterized protein LOC109163532 [Ipomoea nil]|uniref:uncharacterized protein LOC109163532 n=1 Tax=Ipomoea nil TaxID=35883 RepID=UPI000901EA78|nr:PREDICTED: uncharacterized protein LOC109163532 [Ipomoea nil]